MILIVTAKLSHYDLSCFSETEWFPCGNSVFLVPVVRSSWTSWRQEGLGLMSTIDHNTGELSEM